MLVDRRLARPTVTSADVDPQLELARGVFVRGDEEEREDEAGRRPRLAIMVLPGSESETLRQLESRSRRRAPHEVRVFHTLSRACAWLGVDEESIDWPAPDSGEGG